MTICLYQLRHTAPICLTGLVAQLPSNERVSLKAPVGYSLDFLIPGYQLVSGTNYHLILTLEEADSSSSDEDEDDDKETKSDTCDYKIYKPIQGSPEITSECLSDL